MLLLFITCLVLLKTSHAREYSINLEVKCGHQPVTAFVQFTDNVGTVFDTWNLTRSSYGIIKRRGTFKPNGSRLILVIKTACGVISKPDEECYYEYTMEVPNRGQELVEISAVDPIDFNKGEGNLPTLVCNH